MSKKRLGRGLDALLSGAPARSRQAAADDTPPADPTAAAGGTVPDDSSGLRELPIEQIQSGRYQPRRDFDEESLEELAASIRAQGVMQPVVVRPRPQGGYELIAGERRWRAAQRAGLDRIPAVIRDVGDEDASALGLIENIQREDLQPLEEAVAIARLREEFQLTQQQVADAIGKSRVAVANLLRLLNLEPAVRSLLENGDLEMGHARALLALEGAAQEKAARNVAAHALSVRQTEALVRRLQQGSDGDGDTAARPRKDADTVKLERDLSERLGAPVTISHGARGKGQLVIRYSSLEELEGILGHLR